MYCQPTILFFSSKILEKSHSKHIQKESFIKKGKTSPKKKNPFHFRERDFSLIKLYITQKSMSKPAYSAN